MAPHPEQLKLPSLSSINDTEAEEFFLQGQSSASSAQPLVKDLNEVLLSDELLRALAATF